MSLRDRELAHRRQILAAHRDRASEHESVRSGDRANSVIVFRYPWHDMPVVEAKERLHSHRHAPAKPPDDTDNVDLLMPFRNRHEVDDLDCSAIGLEFGRENQRRSAILSTDRANFDAWRDQPMSVVRLAQQSRKAGAGVESGHA